METVRGGLPAARADEQIHALHAQLRAATYEFRENYLADKTGAARDENVCTVRARIQHFHCAETGSRSCRGSCAAKIPSGSSAAFISSRHFTMAGDMMSFTNGSRSLPT